LWLAHVPSSSRMNPCTLGWYLPLLVKDVPGALQPSEAANHSDRESRGQCTFKPSGPDLIQLEEPGGSTRGGNRNSSRDGTSYVAPTLAWHELDAKFRQDLPDEAYIGRLTYRGLIMRACPRVRMLDGVAISRKEREKAEKLLEGVARAKG
jgi:protein NUD1